MPPPPPPPLPPPPSPPLLPGQTKQIAVLLALSTTDCAYDAKAAAITECSFALSDVDVSSAPDTDGNGVYVQTLRSDRSYAGNIGLTQAPNGDHFITMYTGGQGLRLGPGAPGGFNLDLGPEVVDCSPEDVICEGYQRTVVTKLGAETSPSCVETCGSDGQDLVVMASSCYIAGICYDAGETASGIGLPCMACNPSESQTEWSEGSSVGADFCLIDGACVSSGTILSTREADSECQLCIPSKDSYGWAVTEGFEAIASFPPDDCKVAGASIPVVTAPTTDPKTDTETPPMNNSDKEDDTDTDMDLLEEEDSLSGGAIAGIVIGSLAGIGIIVLAAFVMGGRDATRKEDQSPELDDVEDVMA